MTYHIADSLCYTVETNTTLESNYTPIKISLKKIKIYDVTEKSFTV